jgi:hypothetical protein
LFTGQSERTSALTSNTMTDGAGGEIIISTPRLEVQNNASIQAGTGVEVAGIRRGIGQGGNISLNVDNLNIRQKGSITAKSIAKGNAGSISITANTARLTQGSRIATSANQAGGGNIKLQVHKYLYLFDNSEITAHAGGKKTQDKGGNITIESPDIFRLDNSNLLANAYAGNGGNFYITTNDFKVFGNSRIDVSSELGLNGEFILNSTKIRDKDFMPSESLGLSPELSLNRCVGLKENLSKFLITIRDISPPTPADLKTHYYIP